MIVQDACTDVIGRRRVYTASGRQKGSPRGYPNPCAGSGEILRRDAAGMTRAQRLLRHLLRKDAVSAGTASGCH